MKRALIRLLPVAFLIWSGLSSCANVDLNPPVINPVNDGIAPTPGQSGAIRTLQVLGQSLKLSWVKASDPGSAASGLQYLVVQSLTNDIDTVSHAGTNGLVVMDWTSDMDQCVVTNLQPWTTYYFIVLVRDEWGNISNYVMKERRTADSNNNYMPDPSFEADPWTAYVGNPCWNMHYITGGAGVLRLQGGHIRTGSYGIYTYTDALSSLENFTRLDHYDATWKSTKVTVPWNPGESARAWIWHKLWDTITDPVNGNFYIKVIFYSNQTKLAEYESRAFSNVAAGTWETNDMVVVTPPAPAQTQYAEVAFGIWKVSGNSAQYRASYDDVYLSVVTN